MLDQLAELMEQRGAVRKDFETTIMGKTKLSRGFYITIPPDGVYYLHHSGEIKRGVKADSKKAAFWKTEEAATDFLNDWKAKQVS